MEITDEEWDQLNHIIKNWADDYYSTSNDYQWGYVAGMKKTLQMMNDWREEKKSK